MKLGKKPNLKPKIESKGKSYGLKDSALYNLSTKKRLEDVLGFTILELKELSSDNNYRVFELIKNNKSREIQTPTYKLNCVHTRIASLLIRIKPPEYLHSGIKGRSNITNARQHIGSHPVLTVDLKKFYPSVTKKSIYNFFYETMKAGPDVAGILAEICSYRNQVPTGSRLSMPIAFWANHSMYDRLANLCNTKGIRMTVFVDDFTFSGKAVNKHFLTQVEAIIRSAGLKVNEKKTKLYHYDRPKLVTGAIVTADGLLVRNEHHKKIYTTFLEVSTCESDFELSQLQKQIVGRLNAAGQIDKKFKAKAEKFMKEFKA